MILEALRFELHEKNYLNPIPYKSNDRRIELVIQVHDNLLIIAFL